jgi:hypothetical protein
MSCFIKGGAPANGVCVKELEKPNRKKKVVERVMKY